MAEPTGWLHLYLFIRQCSGLFENLSGAPAAGSLACYGEPVYAAIGTYSTARTVHVCTAYVLYLCVCVSVRLCVCVYVYVRVRVCLCVCVCIPMTVVHRRYSAPYSKLIACKTSN
jgi:hypothetical protein